MAIRVSTARFARMGIYVDWPGRLKKLADSFREKQKAKKAAE
jgi:hypothetical protein